MKRFSKPFIALVTLLCLSVSSFAEPPNIAKLKQEIKAYHDSGAYHQELSAVIKRAKHYMLTTVQENQKSANPQKLALVLDIDETSLSNYEKMVAREFTANREQLHQEIQAADAPAIKPMLALYNDAIKHGIKVFFVTGRKQSEHIATKKNLLKAGYHQWADLYLKPDNYNQSSIVPFKSQARAAINRLGYKIIATIGDQHSDILGGHAQKGFKLPNPYYYLP